ncbi:hypothetical protein B0H12DRAFT_848014 [Mycena haematopus]|nr:hypothetical protein B0H12DRAFT_848014 [Mycena haematopus]
MADEDEQRNDLLNVHTAAQTSAHFTCRRLSHEPNSTKISGPCRVIFLSFLPSFLAWMDPLHSARRQPNDAVHRPGCISIPAVKKGPHDGRRVKPQGFCCLLLACTGHQTWRLRDGEDVEHREVPSFFHFRPPSIQAGDMSKLPPELQREIFEIAVRSNRGDAALKVNLSQ